MFSFPNGFQPALSRGLAAGTGSPQQRPWQAQLFFLHSECTSQLLSGVCRDHRSSCWDAFGPPLQWRWQVPTKSCRVVTSKGCLTGGPEEGLGGGSSLLWSALAPGVWSWLRGPHRGAALEGSGKISFARHLTLPHKPPCRTSPPPRTLLTTLPWKAKPLFTRASCRGGRLQPSPAHRLVALAPFHAHIAPAPLPPPLLTW